MNNQMKKSYKIVNINGLNISYSHKKRLSSGPKVSVIFLSGYKSDMFGTKAIFLRNLSRNIGSGLLEPPKPYARNIESCNVG